VWKLKDLKIITKRWQKEQKKKKSTRLTSLDQEISYRTDHLEEGLCSSMMDVTLLDLEVERNLLLKESEELWRQ